LIIKRQDAKNLVSIALYSEISATNSDTVL